MLHSLHESFTSTCPSNTGPPEVEGGEKTCFGKQLRSVMFVMGRVSGSSHKVAGQPKNNEAGGDRIGRHPAETAILVAPISVAAVLPRWC